MSIHTFMISEYPQTFFASGSEIFSSSTQSAGFLSSGSSISLGGLTGGSKSSSKLPDLVDSPLSEISNVLFGLITAQLNHRSSKCMKKNLLDNESV